MAQEYQERGPARGATRHRERDKVIIRFYQPLWQVVCIYPDREASVHRGQYAPVMDTLAQCEHQKQGNPRFDKIAYRVEPVLNRYYLYEAK